jgi:hypothetical protein
MIEHIRRLAGTISAPDLARRLNLSYGSLRTIASKHGISLRIRSADPVAAIARDAGAQACGTTPLALRLPPDVLADLEAEAARRGTAVEDLAARLLELVANRRQPLFAAVLED